MTVKASSARLVEQTPIQTVSTQPKAVGSFQTSTNPTLTSTPVRSEGVPSLRSQTIGLDAITTMFGQDVYDKMVLDDEVEANLGLLTSALSREEIRLEIPNGVHPSERSKARLIVEFCRWVMLHFSLSERSSREALVREMIKVGSAIGEIDFLWKSGDECPSSDKIKRDFGIGSNGFLIPTTLSPRCMCDTALVVDPFNRIVGIIPRKLPTSVFPDGTIYPIERVGDRYSIVGPGGVETPNNVYPLDTVLPRSKFLFLSWTPRCNDVRGDSGLMSAYSPWWVKQQALQKMMQWLDKFAKPSLVGTVGENAQPVCIQNSDGSETTIEPTEVLLQTLQQFEGGSAISLPFGYTLNLLKGYEGGEVFLRVLDAMDRRITRAMTLQHLASGDAAHMSKSSSGSHQDILGLYVIAMRQRVGDALQRDLFRPMIEWNFGSRWVHLTPKVLIGDGDGFPVTPMEASQLMSSGYLATDQLMSVDRLLGLPPRESATSVLMEMQQRKSSSTSVGMTKGSLDREDSKLTKDLVKESEDE